MYTNNAREYLSIMEQKLHKFFNLIEILNNGYGEDNIEIFFQQYGKHIYNTRTSIYSELYINDIQDIYYSNGALNIVVNFNLDISDLNYNYGQYNFVYKINDDTYVHIIKRGNNIQHYKDLKYVYKSFVLLKPIEFSYISSERLIYPLIEDRYPVTKSKIAKFLLTSNCKHFIDSGDITARLVIYRYMGLLDKLNKASIGSLAINMQLHMYSCIPYIPINKIFDIRDIKKLVNFKHRRYSRYLPLIESLIETLNNNSNLQFINCYSTDGIIRCIFMDDLFMYTLITTI